jgi:hypothetical protein
MFKAANVGQIRADVWRRLVLPVHWNLEQLHLGVQAPFNWWNYHLYEVRIGGLRYGEVEILAEDATDDDPRVSGQQVYSRKGQAVRHLLRASSLNRRQQTRRLTSFGVTVMSFQNRES